MEGCMKRDVFISYASKDSKVADDVCEYLEQRGTTCWIAPRNIWPGSEYGQSIIEGIENSKVLVLIYSKHSNDSQHVLREIERAVAKNVPIIAYKISNTMPCKSMEYFLLSNQWLDATTKGKHLEELHNSIGSITAIEAGKMSKDIPRIEIKPGSVMNKITAILIPLACVVLLLAVGFLVLNKENKAKQEEPGIEALSNEGLTQPKLLEHTSQTNSLDQPTQKQDAKQQDLETQDPDQKQLGQQEEGQLGIQEGTQQKPGQTQGNNTIPAEKPQQKPEQTQANNTIPTADPQQKEDQEPIEDLNHNSLTAIDQVLIGDYITFGSYEPQGYQAENGDNKLTWIVVSIDQENNQAVLLSEKVIDMKPFDVAESGIFDKDTAGNSYDRTLKDSYTMEEMMEFRGNSDWETSNIRTWLNSDAARITYQDQAPILRATDEAANSYDLQAGFLYGFSKQEKARICEKNNVTVMNGMEALENGKKAYEIVPKRITDQYDYTGYATKTTKDKVYLLSFDELQKYLYDNNLVIFAEPTQSAIDSDHSSYYKLSLSYDIKYSSWALRSPNGASAHQILAVGFGASANEDIQMYYSTANGIGIRPAITITLDQATFEGEGSKHNPYTIK